ncbi:hypothetical protein [Oceanibaculum nanhaiense]|uniref:hypothetical protein n=1 Tax=Oceanibaculum nanhaiense TaxID=1909734 RepID=UPI003F6FF468
MKNPLASLHPTLMLGLALTVLLVLLGAPAFDQAFWAGIFRWAHVLAGLLWVGLLYYFNLVQIPALAAMPEESRPTIARFVAPKALFWFRWSAVATVLLGLVTAMLSGYLPALWTLGLDGSGPRHTMIGIGMWMALVMAANVWVVIWPCQKKALGIVPAEPAQKQRAARTALLAGRFNLLLSFAMLYAMVMAKSVG